MAIYHLSAKVISRRKGQNAVAAAAYRSAHRLTDFATGEVKRYAARKTRVAFCGIFAPADAPTWACDRERLWNEVEHTEVRKNSTLAREYEISLPHELSDIQRLWLVQDYVRQAFTRKGLVADVAMHNPDRGADRRNVHFHIMVPERQIGAEGFAKRKDRLLQKREYLHSLRRQWADLCNKHLARHGHTNTIDHRSLRDQSVMREPTVHLGPTATEIERRGAKSHRGNQLRAIKARNAALGSYKGEHRDEQSINTPKIGSGTNLRENGGIGRRAEYIRDGGRPGLDASGFAGSTGLRSHFADGGYRGLKSGRRPPCQRHSGARLRLALWRLLSAIKETRIIAAQVAEQAPIENTDFRAHVDLWGIGQLPPAPR